MTPVTSFRSFELLAELVPDGLVMVGVDGIVLGANSELARLLGYEKAEIVGRSIEQFVPDRFQAAHVEHRTGFFASGGSRSMGVGLDLRARRADGSELPVDVSLRTIELDGVAVVVAAVRDVTAQRDAERASAILEIVRGATRSGVVVLETSGVIAGVNTAATRLLGVEADDLVGRPFDETVLGATPAIRRTLCDCLGGRHIENHRVMLATQWGEPTPVSLTARPVGNDRGGIVAVSMLAFDLTEQEASQASLRALQARLEVTERLGGIGSWEFNGATGELQMSPGLHALTGIDALEFPGTIDAFLSSMVDETAASFTDRLARCLDHGEHLSLEGELRGGEGAARWIAIEGDRITVEPSSGHRRASGIVQDLTERHEVMEDLLLADRLKDEFLATVSHELRTPLTVIVGFAELLLALAEDATRGYLSALFRNAAEMRIMVDQLLDMSRIHSGELQFDPSPCALHDITTEVVADVAIAFASHRIVNQTSSTAVWTDPQVIRRILSNLVSNAAKFSKPGTTITITDEVAGGWATVTVSDEGVGIAPADAESIFEPFVQARHGRPLDVRGTGVGLAIVHRYVELHGGRVWVESELGEGSRFHFTVELAPHTSTATADR